MAPSGEGPQVPTYTLPAPTPRGMAMAGGAAGAILAPELELPVLGAGAAASIAGAGVGGAAGHVAAGGKLSEAPAAGAEQAGYEALGQGVGKIINWPLRALATSRVGKAATAGISDALTGAAAKWDALKSSLSGVSPADVGRMTDAATQGPGRRSLSLIGQRVEEAAKTGPPVDFTPVKAAAAKMTASTQPAAAAGSGLVGADGRPLAAMTGKGGYTLDPAVQAKIAARNPGVLESLPIEEGHPLNGVLKQIQEAPDQVSFEDAHKYKRALDDATNWESPAKKQVQQVTKGVRGSVRSAMAAVGHQPYEQATAAYQTAAPLFNKGYVKALAQHAADNPESLIKGMSGDKPTSLQMLFDVLDTHAAEGGGAQMGQQAKAGIQSAWTYKNLIKPGIENFPKQAAKMDPAFQATMFGDPQGQQVFKNLADISGAYQQALTDEAGFKASTLSKPPPKAAQVASDVAHVTLMPHSVFSLRSLGRLATGEGSSAKMADLVEWASRSPASTKALVTALQHNMPGMAVANLARSAGIAMGPEPDRAAATTPPPDQQQQQLAATPPPGAAVR